MLFFYNERRDGQNKADQNAEIERKRAAEEFHGRVVGYSERPEAVEHQIIGDADRARKRNSVRAENNEVLNRENAPRLRKFAARGKKNENGDEYRRDTL